jgi:hypothetical protein
LSGAREVSRWRRNRVAKQRRDPHASLPLRYVRRRACNVIGVCRAWVGLIVAM